jgi:signal peptidase I
MPGQKSIVRMLLQPIAIAVALGLTARAAVHIYSIPSASMAPTLLAGDQIVVTRYFGGTPQRGDVVVFASPVEPDQLLVKRVIGVPGDLIDSRLGRVRIGGRTLAEPYILRSVSAGAISSHIVPAESYFMLGDNRDDSTDSRVWGFVHQSAVVGRARLVLWSSSPELGVQARAEAVEPRGDGDGGRSRGRLFKWID